MLFEKKSALKIDENYMEDIIYNIFIAIKPVDGHSIFHGNNA